MKFTVSSPMKALEALKKLFPDSSRRTLQGWVRLRRFTVDGKPLQKEDILLQEGQIVMAKETCLKPLCHGVPILYEDHYCVAIEKPVGLLSVPLNDERSSKHALGLLRRFKESDQIFAVHRIDRETSGALLFAKGKRAQEKFKNLFEKHLMKRQYFAITEGRVREDQGTWNQPLLELPSYEVIHSMEGRAAVTHFRVERRSAKYSYLKLDLETGRKHQIRVHCQLAGHPIVGDSRYGAIDDPIHRLCLHSMYMEFIHPFTQMRVSISSPLPKSFQVLGATRTTGH